MVLHYSFNLYNIIMAKKLKQTEFDDTRRVVDDPIFIRIVTEKVEALKQGRLNRPVPQPGYHYKRNWYDKLADLDGCNAEFFLNNINDIWLKKSNLSSEIRGVILEVCNQAVVRTMQEYHSQGEKKADIKIAKDGD